MGFVVVDCGESWLSFSRGLALGIRIVDRGEPNPWAGARRFLLPNQTVLHLMIYCFLLFLFLQLVFWLFV